VKVNLRLRQIILASHHEKPYVEAIARIHSFDALHPGHTLLPATRRLNLLTIRWSMVMSNMWWIGRIPASIGTGVTPFS